MITFLLTLPVTSAGFISLCAVVYVIIREKQLANKKKQLKDK